jgi:hypothetical protein
MAIPTESGQGDPAFTAGNIQSVDSKIFLYRPKIIFCRLLIEFNK